MIELHPIPEVERECPHCGLQLETLDWHIPGMRMLAELACGECGREYFADLAAGHGIFYAAILETDTGTVHAPVENWFTDLLEDSYERRTSDPVGFDTEQSDSLSDPILLNCLDVNYIHSVNKLLNAQRYSDEDRDLVVLVPEFLRWMVPREVDVVWTVDVSLSGGRRWNDWLGARIREEIAQFDRCSLSIAHPHPHPDVYDVVDFTGVTPFPTDEWTDRLEEPTVTFVWRGAVSYSSPRRLWCSTPGADRYRRKLRGSANWAVDKLGTPALALREQRSNIVTAAEELRSLFPGLDCAVAGVGCYGTFPDWMTDIRYERPDEKQERRLCERYAASHVVAGVHGSHLALPSGHAGAVVEVMPEAKRGNMLGDLIFRPADQRDTLLRYRTLPASTPVRTVAREIASVLVHWPSRWHRLRKRWDDEVASLDELTEIRRQEARTAELVSRVADRD